MLLHESAAVKQVFRYSRKQGEAWDFILWQQLLIDFFQILVYSWISWDYKTLIKKCLFPHVSELSLFQQNVVVFGQ